MATIFKAIKRLGWSEGLKTYSRLKINKGNFKLSELDYPLTLRPNTSDTGTFRQIFFRGEYDIDPGFDPEYIIDGGANIGLFAVLFASRYRNAKIYSIEPDMNNFSLLLENTQQYKNVTCIQSGIWDKETYLKIVDQGWGEWGYMVEEVPEQTAGAIKAVSLNGIMHQYELPRLDIVKLDVEGAEMNIFGDDYSEWLSKTRLLIIELHDRMKPGSSDPFWKAIRKLDFRRFDRGENLCFINNTF